MSRIAALVAICLSLGLVSIHQAGVSLNKPAWADEIFSYWMASYPGADIGEVVENADAGRDGMMKGFYVLSFLWAKFGAPHVVPFIQEFCEEGRLGPQRLPWLALTLVGVVWLCSAIWTSRGPWAAAGVAAIAAFGCPEVFEMGGDLRGYALVIAGGCISYAGFLRWGLTLHSLPWLATFSLGLTLMAAGQAFGLVYGACLVAVMGLTHPRKWLSVLVAALPAAVVTATSLEGLISAGGLVRPWNWPEIPGFPDLIKGWASPRAGGILMLAIVAGAMLGVDREQIKGRGLIAKGEGMLLAAWFLVPALVWIYSQYGTTLFVGRYFLLSRLAFGIAITALLTPRGAAVLTAVMLAAGAADAHRGWGGRVAGKIAAGKTAEATARPDATEKTEEGGAGDGRQEKDGWKGADGKTLRVFFLTDNLHRKLERDFYPRGSTKAFFYYNPETAYSWGKEPRLAAMELNIALRQAEVWNSNGGKSGIDPSTLVDVRNVRRWLEETKPDFVELCHSSKGKSWKPVSDALAALGWTKFSTASEWCKRTPSDTEPEISEIWTREEL